MLNLKITRNKQDKTNLFTKKQKQNKTTYIFYWQSNPIKYLN